MPYISRDENNKIISIHNKPQVEDQEFLPNSAQEVLHFLRDEDIENEGQLFLSQSDTDLIRVLEDLVDLLTEKHVILFTELPVAAQNKLLQRKSVRRDLHAAIIDTEEDNIF